MRIYILTDEVSEEVINIMLFKNDNAARKRINLEFQKYNKDIEVKLHTLDIDVDFDDKLIVCGINGEIVPYRTIYSFPQDLITLNSDEIKADITAAAQKEVEGEDE